MKQVRIPAGLSCLLILPVLGACVAGPDFHSPVSPVGAAYTAAPLAGQTSASAAPAQAGAALGSQFDAQHWAANQDLPPAWWTLFGQDTLNAWVAEALAASPSLAAAQAALRQAQASLEVQVGNTRYPAVDASVSAAREKISGASQDEPNLNVPPFTLYGASVAVSYRFDLAGGIRRATESLQAQVDQQRWLLEAARLSLAGNVVTAAIQQASLQAQRDATLAVLDNLDQQLRIVQGQFNSGAATRTDILTQQVQIAQTRAGLPALDRQLALAGDRLQVLRGRLPGDPGTAAGAAAGVPVLPLDTFVLPASVPLSVPSALARKRPDILAAEAQLHAANAQVGVAESALYPQLNLSAAVGAQALRAGHLFDTPSRTWDLAAGLTQPLFHGGALRAQTRAAQAAYDQALAAYRETVIEAFAGVADSLQALDADANSLAAQAEAEAAARNAADLAQKQYATGATNYLALLTAQRQYQQARIAVIQARAARLADTAALMQALGGAPLPDQIATAAPAAPAH